MAHEIKIHQHFRINLVQFQNIYKITLSLSVSIFITKVCCVSIQQRNPSNFAHLCILDVTENIMNKHLSPFCAKSTIKMQYRYWEIFRTKSKWVHCETVILFYGFISWKKKTENKVICGKFKPKYVAIEILGSLG